MDPNWLLVDHEEQTRHRSPHDRGKVQCRTWWEAAGSLWSAFFRRGA